MIDFYIFEYLTQAVVNTSDMASVCIWHGVWLVYLEHGCLWAICPCGLTDGWTNAAAPKRISASCRPSRRLSHEKHWRYFNQSKMPFWKLHGAKQCSVFISPKAGLSTAPCASSVQNFHLGVPCFYISFTSNACTVALWLALQQIWVPQNSWVLCFSPKQWNVSSCSGLRGRLDYRLPPEVRAGVRTGECFHDIASCLFMLKKIMIHTRALSQEFISLLRWRLFFVFPDWQIPWIEPEQSKYL